MKTKNTPSEALASLVAALDSTNWSSWQTTASFSDQLDAARRTIAHERLAEAAPDLLANLKFAVKLLGAIPAISGTAQVEAMRAAITKATGEEA